MRKRDTMRRQVRIRPRPCSRQPHADRDARGRQASRAGRRRRREGLSRHGGHGRTDPRAGADSREYPQPRQNRRCVRPYKQARFQDDLRLDGQPARRDLRSQRQGRPARSGRTGTGAPRAVPRADQRALRSGSLEGGGDRPHLGTRQRGDARLRDRRRGYLRRGRADRADRAKAAGAPARRRPATGMAGKIQPRVHDRTGG